MGRAGLALALVLLAGGVLYLTLGRASSRPGILLVGLDGADWDVLDPLIEAGRLPNLARLKDEGVHGPLDTLEDIPLSPVIWTSVATGKKPAKHGITWFLVDTPDGERVPVRSHNRRVRALWNLMASEGLRPGFVGWWASAPAEDVSPGVMVSDALGYHGFGRTGQGLADERKTHPAALFGELSLLVPPVAQVDYSLGQRFFDLPAEEFYERAASTRRSAVGERFEGGEPVRLFQEGIATTIGYTAIAKHLLATAELDLLAVYYESTDSMSHLFMKYAPPRRAWIDEADFARFSQTVDRTYEFVDERLGELLAALPRDWSVMVVSDHGFRVGDERPRSVETVDIRGAHLDHAREGVFLAAGPLFGQGELHGASVLDVTPTLLHAFGLPVARDMDGRVLSDAFDAGFLAQHPIRYVETYETTPHETPSPVEDEGFGTEGAMARLEALGYVGEAAGEREGDDASAPAEDEVSSPEQHNNLGRIHLSNGEVEAARRAFEAALALAPENADALANLGVLHLARGRQDLALGFLTRAIQSNPNHVPALLQVAELRKQGGQLDVAESLYRQVLAIDDRLPAPYLGLGDILFRTGRAEEARALFRTVVELDPLSADGHYNLGVASAELVDLEGATAAYERALELAPDQPLVLNNLGELHLRQERRAEALDSFRRAAEASPGHVESRFNVASILLHDGKPAEAIPWLEEAVELRPDLEVAQELLARAHLALGDLGEARARYEMLVRMYPGSVEPCLQLARISLREEKNDEAVLWLENSVRRGGPPVEATIRADAELGAWLVAPTDEGG